jgi:dienelactone hydrolase
MFRCLVLVCCAAVPAAAQSTEALSIRGREQSLRIYGSRGGQPVIVSSGDGGWTHLGPHVAELLAACGYFVVGFDAKAYLESFTSAKTTLSPEDVPWDYKVLADFAAAGSGLRPILVGVSEGAGLSVLAAAGDGVRPAIAGVVGLGLPDINELGTFSTAALVSKVAPVPLAAIHSTHDGFVPRSEIERVLSSAREPKKLWLVNAADHRFSGNLAEFDRRLLEALAWTTQMK